MSLHSMLVPLQSADPFPCFLQEGGSQNKPKPPYCCFFIIYSAILNCIFVKRWILLSCVPKLDFAIGMFWKPGWRANGGGWCLVLSVAGKVSVCPYVPELPPDHDWGPWSMQTLHHQGAPADSQASGRWWKDVNISLRKLWRQATNLTFVASSDG